MAIKPATKKGLLFLFVIAFLIILGKFVLDQKHKSYCLNLSIQKSNMYLISKGFHEANDHSWQDASGNYPDSKTDTANEKFMSKIYNECILFKSP